MFLYNQWDFNTQIWGRACGISCKTHAYLSRLPSFARVGNHVLSGEDAAVMLIDCNDNGGPDGGVLLLAVG